MRRLLTHREDDALPVLKRTPKFSEYADQYLNYFKTVKDAKRPKTLQTESGHLNAWKKHRGDTRIDQINRAMINGFIARLTTRLCQHQIPSITAVFSRKPDCGSLPIF